MARDAYSGRAICFGGRIRKIAFRKRDELVRPLLAFSGLLRAGYRGLGGPVASGVCSLEGAPMTDQLTDLFDRHPSTLGETNVDHVRVREQRRGFLMAARHLQDCGAHWAAGLLIEIASKWER